MPGSNTGSYNSLSFGDATNYHVSGLVGILDLPEYEWTNKPKAVGTGMFRGPCYARALKFSLMLELIAPIPKTAAGLDTLIDAVRAAFVPNASADLPLRFWGNTRYVYCSPIAVKFPVDTEMVQTDMEVTIDFLACNPTIYSGSPP